MTIKKDKMTTYQCDLCHTDNIDKLKMANLTMRTADFIFYHICENCIPKIKDSIGSGEKREIR